MIEALDQIIGLIKELPEFAIWILAGLLLYKVIIIGSYVGLIRLAIIKLYDYLSKDRPVGMGGSHLFVNTSVRKGVIDFLKNEVKPSGDAYLFTGDLHRLENAWREREK